MVTFSLEHAESLQSFLSFFLALEKNKRLHHAWILQETDAALTRKIIQKIAENLLTSYASSFDFLATPSPDFFLLEDDPSTTTDRISVEAIRRLISFSYKSPTHGQTKIAVVLKAHTLTIQAQNALLKTLEAPPVGVFILIVTPFPSKLLSTIRSRCQMAKMPLLSEVEFESALSYQPDYVKSDKDHQNILRYLSQGRLDKAYAFLESGRYHSFINLFNSFKKSSIEGDFSEFFQHIVTLGSTKDQNMLEFLKESLFTLLTLLKAAHLGELPSVLSEWMAPLKEKSHLSDVAHCYSRLSILFDQADVLMLDQKQTFINCFKEFELLSKRYNE